MSKSKGNGIDPIHIIEGATMEQLKTPVLDARPSNMKTLLKDIEKKYADGFEGVGADALRYTLIHLCSSGQELKLSLDNFLELGRRFITKLWNASRFILMHIDVDKELIISSPSLKAEDTWIDIRISQATTQIRDALDSYNFKSINQIYYQLVWNDFCDWYIEIAKIRLQSKNSEVKKAVVIHLSKCFVKILKLLHPLTPFVSEEIWRLLNEKASEHNLWGSDTAYNQPLILSSFPKAEIINVEQKNIIEQFSLLQKIITSIRSLKAQYQIKDKELVSFKYRLINDSLKDVLKNKNIICRLAKVTGCEECQDRPKHFFSIAETDYEIYLDLKDFVDMQSEKNRLEKQLEVIEKDILLVGKKLANENFIKKAKPEKVDIEKKKSNDLKIKKKLVENSLNEIKAMITED
ncbi:MAG: class I tRNA ligase family protein [Gammaproteobacteria bacterium]|nr:class I tRNA ligase family protein [Gammaproteobacteria bacterium]